MMKTLKTGEIDKNLLKMQKSKKTDDFDQKSKNTP